jgi:D-aspartate ligase
MASPTFVSLILGGDIGAYALGREFHEACGVRSVCASQDPIDAITKSRIFECASVSRLDDAEVERVVRETAAEHPDQKVLLITNLESVVGCVCRLEGRLPENVVTPTPTQESVEVLAHKDRFIRLCRERNLPTPATEIVDLSGDAAVPPSEIDFPVVAKPSFSAEYAPFIAQGFRKVYLMSSQAELDELWGKLRAAGFSGTFLVRSLSPATTP